MCFDLNMALFCYNDSEYFNWFAEPNEENLKKIIKWKGLHRIKLFDKKDDFWNDGNIVFDNVNDYGIVTKAFIYHLHKPTEYPILDRFVWKAMRKLGGNVRNMHFYEWESDYSDIYVPFFKARYEEYEGLINCPQIDDVDDDIIKRRMLDRALWEYGRMLQ